MRGTGGLRLRGTGARCGVIVLRRGLGGLVRAVGGLVRCGVAGIIRSPAAASSAARLA